MRALMRKLKGLLAPRAAKVAGERLYAQCVAQARQPVFYLDYAIPDEIGARFELLTFHVGLVIHVLRAEKTGPRVEQAQETAQALFDTYLVALDSMLREQGTGDLSVPKKMKKLGQVIYTRMHRWDQLWSEGAAAQADYAARTLYAGDALDDMKTEVSMKSAVAGVPAAVFAAYARAALLALRPEIVLEGRLDWPSPANMRAA